MPISDKYKCIFIHIPKNAGSSIEIALDMFRHDYQRPHLDALFGRLGNRNMQHMTAIELSRRQDLLPEYKFRTYFKFAFVRNPWERVVSDYLSWSTNLGRSPFDKFVENMYRSPHLQKTQYQYVYDRSGNCLVDFIGRHENLEKDWEFVSRYIGCRKCLPRYNKASEAKPLKLGYLHYSKYYDEVISEIVRKKFKKDIEFFNYTFKKEDKL